MSQVPREADAAPLPVQQLTTAEFVEAVTEPAPAPVPVIEPDRFPMEPQPMSKMTRLGLIALAFGLISVSIGVYYTLQPSKLLVGENQIGVHWDAPTAPPTVWTTPGSHSYRGGKTYVYTNIPRAFYARVESFSKDGAPYLVDVKYKWIVKDAEHFFALYDSWENAEAYMKIGVQAYSNSALKSYDKGAVARNKDKIGKVIEKGLASEFWTYNSFEIEIGPGKPVKLISNEDKALTSLQHFTKARQLGREAKRHQRKPVRYVQRRPRECGFMEIGCF